MNVFFRCVFVVFLDLKIISDDFDVENMNGDFGATRLSVKKACFFFHDEASERKDTVGRVHFDLFLVMIHAKFRKSEK